MAPHPTFCFHRFAWTTTLFVGTQESDLRHNHPDHQYALLAIPFSSLSFWLAT
jgi:hypothetical protein